MLELQQKNRLEAVDLEKMCRATGIREGLVRLAFTEEVRPATSDGAKQGRETMSLILNSLPNGRLCNWPYALGLYRHFEKKWDVAHGHQSYDPEPFFMVIRWIAQCFSRHTVSA